MNIPRIDAVPLTFSESVQSTPTIEPLSGSSEVGASGGISFENLLSDAISQANRLDFEASKKTDALAAGKIDDIHGTMIAVKEADISVKLVGTVRNKVLDAFQELWRISV